MDAHEKLAILAIALTCSVLEAQNPRELDFYSTKYYVTLADGSVTEYGSVRSETNNTQNVSKLDWSVFRPTGLGKIQLNGDIWVMRRVDRLQH